MIQSRHDRRAAFSIIELIVVIGIIVILASILIVTAGKVQKAAHSTNTAAEIAHLQAAIETYYGDFKSYPGPVPDTLLHQNGNSLPPGATKIFIVDSNGGATAPLSWITGTENLVLGLLGGVYFNPTSNQFEYDIRRTLNSAGPQSLNTAGLPKTSHAYVTAETLFVRDVPNNAAIPKTGQYKDDIVAAQDSHIPEFVDRYPSPMPVLYLRARRGVTPSAAAAAGNPTATDNPVITDGSTVANTGTFAGTYDLSAVIGYTGAFPGGGGNAMGGNQIPPPPDTLSIGLGKSIDEYWIAGAQKLAKNKADVPTLFHGLRTVDPTRTAGGANSGPGTNTYYVPMDAYAYFENPSMPNTPRQKDGYVLISAGPDRVYGTPDDITNFGSPAR
jgi:type II secretory pathway pseudopilin PulG